MNVDHSAQYDDDGNIILPGSDAANGEAPMNWSIVSEHFDQQPSVQPTASRLSRQPSKQEGISKQTRTKVSQLGRVLFKESTAQYRSSADGVKSEVATYKKGLRKTLGAVWGFLTQPVWIMHPRRKEPKQYSRLTLFVLDTVRFGGTFAAIFVFLFVTLNYQSFWQITNSYLQPLTVASETTEATIDSALREKLLKSPSLATAGKSEGNLLHYLNEVGPPENWLIIPRLNIKVPLVTPAYTALMNEDWSQLETDIQKALELGVVHYPGTARPGQAGNFFVTGHSSYYPFAPGDYKNVFARLTKLNVGDEYYVYYGGDKHKYIIRHKKEVRPTNVAVLDQPVDKRMATLMTCTPVGTTLRRLILEAEEVDPITNVTLSVGEAQKRKASPKFKMQSLPI